MMHGASKDLARIRASYQDTIHDGLRRAIVARRHTDSFNTAVQSTLVEMPSVMAGAQPWHTGLDGVVERHARRRLCGGARGAQPGSLLHQQQHQMAASMVTPPTMACQHVGHLAPHQPLVLVDGGTTAAALGQMPMTMHEMSMPLQSMPFHVTPGALLPPVAASGDLGLGTWAPRDTRARRSQMWLRTSSACPPCSPPAGAPSSRRTMSRRRCTTSSRLT